MKEKLSFIAKVALVHTVTYILCGVVSMTLFNYQSSLSAIGMRDTSDLMVMLAPLFQLGRGALFGVVLWLLRPAFMGRKHGWLIIWATIVILGIFNTPATSPGSIEAFIYLAPTAAPLNTSIGGTLEILIQTLLFSIAAAFWLKRINPKRHTDTRKTSPTAEHVK